VEVLERLQGGVVVKHDDCKRQDIPEEDHHVLYLIDVLVDYTETAKSVDNCARDVRSCEDDCHDLESTGFHAHLTLEVFIHVMDEPP